MVIFEASGVYHRELETSLAKNAVPYTKVNLRQARRFAEGEPLTRHWSKHNGDWQDRKIDKVDAEMLAGMGAILQLEP